MEFKALQQSVQNLHEVVNEFPIGAVSLDDFKPVEEKIQITRQSLMHLSARLLMLKAKYKRMLLKLNVYTDRILEKDGEGTEDVSQRTISDTLINTKAIKLCLHSTTILSIFDNKEGTPEDQKKLYAYMSKLFTLTDDIMSTLRAIEKASEIQYNSKIECQMALFDYTDFLKVQKEIRSKKLQEKYPEAVRNQNKVKKSLRKINIMKKLIRNFIAASDDMLMEKSILNILEKHRDLINFETVLKMSQNNENVEAI